MEKIILTVWILVLGFSGISQTGSDTEAVNAAVSSFLKSWNQHNFKDLPDYTTEDFTYSNPLGNIHKRRDSVLRQLQSMHDGDFKGTSLTEESRDVRMITPDAAVVTLTAVMGAVPALGVQPGKQLRTFVIAKQKGKWLLTTLQTTSISPSPQATSTGQTNR